MNALNERVLDKLHQDGEIFLTNAIINERYCLRGCIVNFRTSKKDVEEIIEIAVREGIITHDALQAEVRSNLKQVPYKTTIKIGHPSMNKIIKAFHLFNGVQLIQNSNL